MQKAMTHHRNNELQEAFDTYMDVIDVQPKHFAALHLAGVVLVQVGHYDKALHLLDRAKAITSNNHELQYNRANALFGLDRFKEALQGYSRAIELRPNYALAFLGQSNVLTKLEAHEHAAACIDCAIKLMPDYELLFFNRGNIMDTLGKTDEAIRSFDRAIELQPTYGQAWHNRANLLGLTKRFDEAKSGFNEAIRLNPQDDDAYVSLAATYLALREFDDAIKTYEQVIALSPENAEAHFGFSHCLLQSGQFDRAWGEYNWRWDTKDYMSRRKLLTIQPPWSPDKKPDNLLIWAEQGVGDEIFWGANFKAAQKLANKLTVQTDPRLISLFSRALPDIQFVSSKESVPQTAYDAHLPMGDLGQALKLNAQSIQKFAGPYLKADAAKAKKMRAALCPKGQKLCGISWKSSNKDIGAKKSMRLEDLLPALRLPGMVFVNLQYGDVAQEIADLKAEHGIEILQYSEVDNFNDLDGLANLIEACDVVLTTSNSTAHLAGALNQETINLVSFGGARIWYWLNEVNGRSLWYPSVKLVEQERDDDGWSAAVDRAVKHMSGLVS
jgi:tetratricopeptide (TPR) repeat protein